jgi:hypothetical protein
MSKEKTRSPQQISLKKSGPSKVGIIQGAPKRDGTMVNKTTIKIL